MSKLCLSLLWLTEKHLWKQTFIDATLPLSNICQSNTEMIL